MTPFSPYLRHEVLKLPAHVGRIFRARRPAGVRGAQAGAHARQGGALSRVQQQAHAQAQGRV